MNFNYLIISSKARSSAFPNSNSFSISLPQPVLFDEVQLISAQVPYTYYNVNSSDTLVVEWNSVKTAINIAGGNYSLTQLASALQTQIQSTINSNITVTFSVQQFTFVFNFANASPNQGSLILSKSTQSLCRILGFPGTVDTIPQSILISTTASQSMDQQYLYINLDPVPQTNLQTTVTSITSFYVPITVNSGDLISYIPTTDNQQRIYCSKTYYQNFNVSLRDMFGNLLNLNNVDWSFVVKLCYKENTNKGK